MRKFFIPVIHVLLLPFAALAIHGAPGSTPTAPFVATPIVTAGPTTIADWFLIVQDVVGWLFAFAMIFGVGALIVGGILYITAGGNEARSERAVKLIIYAVIGIAVAALAWAITNLVGQFFVEERVID